ncbi:MAG: hypothetical protein MI757_14110 [Pirellulales bacterium]|nr:hypothetical protein [Pirellulales bacterium]
MTYTARGETATTVNPDDKRVTYAYDSVAGRRTTMTDPDSGLFTYSYDGKGLLTGLTNPQNETTTQTFDPLDRCVKKEVAAGTITSHGYDAGSNLVNLDNVDSGGTFVNRFTYTYDNVGNRKTELAVDGTLTTWTYDRTYQLNREQRTDA